MDPFLTNLNESLANLPFWIGLFSVGAFAYSRFDVSLPDVDELSPPLRPSSFTTAFRFWHAACTYFGLYALLYLGLLVMGTIPTLRDYLSAMLVLPPGSPSDAKIGTPAWAALVATAVLPAMPIASTIDERLRGLLQDFASIPTKARMLADDVLFVIEPKEPSECDDDATIEVIVSAIKRHKERAEEIFAIYSKLSDEQVVAGGVGRRYAKFLRAYQKNFEGFKQDFVVSADAYATSESARYVEHKYRVGVRKLARFLMCAVLGAEATEFGARERLNRLGVKVPNMVVEFPSSLIILSLVAIFLMTLVGCYASALLFVAIHQPAGETVSSLLSRGTGTFFVWSIGSVLFYTLPLVFAAGATMYVLDRKATGEDIDSNAIATSVVLTFIGSAAVALFILLPTTFVTERILPDGHQTKFWELVPWIIPPAAIATTFMYMSSNWKPGSSWISNRLAYVIVHGAAAATAAIIAYLLWRATGATVDSGRLPERLFLYLVPVTAGAIGAGIGWVLAGTRKEARPA